jgi:Tol biopolymer transport system component
MGEVYEATDSKLGRSVAIKLLPEEFNQDSDRLRRFEREARVLASLNHPNIAAIHGLEESGGRKFLVMELVGGETLTERIERGPIPVDESLAIATAICEGLEAAHEKGIIHRDLKPANVKVTSDGKVKVLDFGLAYETSPSNPNLSNSPTMGSIATTNAGVILGTAAYMSPEQARGKEVDSRTDIWAFGCVLYEMLSGHRAFDGEDVTEILAAVMKTEPDWSRLPVATPPPIRVLLRRCLRKDGRQRLKNATDVRIEIEEARTEPEVSLQVSPRGRQWLAWTVVAFLFVVAVTFAMPYFRTPAARPNAAGAIEFSIAPPENTSFGGPPGAGTGGATQVAVSPDGQNIVFVAGAQSAYQIWLRPLTNLAAKPIPGTEGGAFPFWSPDSRFIGFFSGGKLKKVQIAGGPPSVLCDAQLGRGGTWSRDNVILFAPSAGTGLVRVSSAGGVPTVVTTLDPATGETNHRWPHFLPDGRHFIYTASTGACCPAPKPAMIRIGSLDEAGTATLLQTESSVSYASGHLLFARDETLMAQPFDLEARQLKGDAFPLAEYVGPEGSRYVSASVSENGTLAYAQHPGPADGQLRWFDRAGRAGATLGEAGAYTSVALSPDERRVAVALRTGNPENQDIWIIDIARNIRSRLTVDPGADESPVWSLDGTRITFGGQRSGKVSLRQQLINETAADESVLEVLGTPSRPCDLNRQCNIWPNSWSRDGRFIAYTLAGSFPRTSDVWVLPLFGDRKPFPLAQSAFLESTALFSPDGRWIAYTTDEAGQPNVYVQPFLRAGAKYQISRNGGSRAVWRADGKELFYVGADGTMMAVPIDASGQFQAGVPQALFPTGVRQSNFNPVYTVTKNGERFLMNTVSKQIGERAITVVLNWTASLKK